MTVPEMEWTGSLAEALRLEGITATPTQVEALHRRLTEPHTITGKGDEYGQPLFYELGEDISENPDVKDLVQGAKDEIRDDAESRWSDLTYRNPDITRDNFWDITEEQWRSDLDDFVCDRVNAIVEDGGAKILVRRNDR